MFYIRSGITALASAVVVVTGISGARVAGFTMRGGAQERPRAVSAETESCRAIKSADAMTLLRDAAHAMRLDSVEDRARRSVITELISDGYQNDRMYPPTPFRSTSWMYIVSPGDNVQGRTRLPVPNAPPNSPPATLTQLQTDRVMDPWLVVSDWSREPRGATATQECFYRDYWRTVITRRDTGGVMEKLYVDGKTGYPVKLDRRESHYLWGDRHVEYVWTTWQRVGPATAPRMAYMIADGETERAWTHTSFMLIPRDSVPATAPPQTPPGVSITDGSDTVRIAPNIFALTNPAYSNIVMLVRDTVYILDAQLSEARARSDSVWIAKLFPGHHPLVLVVTDLAWPHIAGVRFWAASGVPIVTHGTSRGFLQSVLAHRWTLHPDKFERNRASIKPVIRVVNETTRLARGELVIAPLDGISSEGALIAYAPGQRFLYVGDYIQSSNLGPQRPGALRFTYLDEVVDAVQRNHFDPVTFSAMHVKPTPWSSATASQ